MFRREYGVPTPDQQMKIDDIKDEAGELLEVLHQAKSISDKRCFALAITKLEECVMWATKAIT